MLTACRSCSAKNRIAESRRKSKNIVQGDKCRAAIARKDDGRFF
nr:MAG TPA: hypothetical protein [Siphoviridae sp. ctedi74]